jgi:putative photosynthetic complex assembly protein 2
MSDYGLPALFALFLWWAGTGVVLYVDGLPPSTFRRSMLAATLLLVVSLWGLVATRDSVSVGGAYLAFAAALGAWGWVETAFLLGYTTGTRKTACAPGCRGWPHFVHGLQAIVYHELAIVAVAAAVFASTAGGENQVGMWTFLVLWAMRQSAKLNVFLGVRNLSEEFLPVHLRYLQSYLTRRPMNPLLPVSVAVATALALSLFGRAWSEDATAYEVAAYSLVASLLTLGVLEHWFMVLPVSTTTLWKWGLISHRPDDNHDIGAPPRDPNRDRFDRMTGLEPFAVVPVESDRCACAKADVKLRRH